MKDLINLAQNLDCYWLYPTVRSEEDYGYYLIDELDELELPEEAKKYFKYEEYGRDAQLATIRGSLPNRAISITIRTPLPNGIGERKTRYPKNTALWSSHSRNAADRDKTFMDAAATEQTARTAAEQPQEPHPVIPIVLTARKPAEN